MPQPHAALAPRLCVCVEPSMGTSCWTSAGVCRFSWWLYPVFGAASCADRIDTDACIAEYAAKGRDDQLVRMGRLLCHVVSDARTREPDRQEALCALKTIGSVPTMAAFEDVVLQCRDSRQ